MGEIMTIKELSKSINNSIQLELSEKIGIILIDCGYKEQLQTSLMIDCVGFVAMSIINRDVIVLIRIQPNGIIQVMLYSKSTCKNMRFVFTDLGIFEKWFTSTLN